MTPAVRRTCRALSLAAWGGRALLRSNTALTREEWRAISLRRLRDAEKLVEGMRL